MTQDQSAERKTYAIGDAHGRFDLVCQAISLAEADAGEIGGVFVCCGDFIDRGPQGRNIIDLFMAGPSLPNWRWIILKGNHEDIMLQALAEPELKLHWWLRNGGGSTLASYGYAHGDALKPLRVPRVHLEWLAALPLYHADAHRVFVHAGLDPSLPLDQQSEQEMMWVRSGRRDDYSFDGKHVVHGHEQFADGPILLSGRTDLDTFAWLTGRLAVGVFDPAKPGGPATILWATGAPDARYGAS
jgi:serine/threonine protein phosphatase 1